MKRLGGIGAALAAAWLLAACGDDDGAAPSTDAGTPVDAGGEVDAGAPDAGPPPFEPDTYCPGGPDCPDEGDGVLHVGAAALTITPTFDDSTEIMTVDVDGDVHYEPGDGDEFRDANMNGTFEGIWLAGFGNPRPAAGVHDDVWVRAIALRQNETTIVLAAIDAVGWFKDDVDVIRGMITDMGVDYLMMAATHDHQAPDTLGIWGLSESQTGVYPEHMAFIHERAAQVIRDAVAALEPASVTYASFRLRDAPGGVSRYHGDQRDPIIVDDEVRVMRFDAVGGGTIATMVNWAAHPEFLWDENDQISSDYAHWLRTSIEEGTVGPDGAMAPGLGGVAVFFPGALGGQIGPNRIMPAQWDGTPVMNRTLEAAQVVGSQVGWLVLDALGPSGGAVTDATANLGFRNRTFLVDVQNRGYHVAILNALFQREAFNWDPELALIPGENEPDIETEIAVIDIGRAQLITAPGELHPELFVGYDATYVPAGQTITTEGNPNPPDMTMAPGPPYLRDLARDDAEHVFLMGLGCDMLGYLIPSFNYELHPTNPYLDEAEGHHYEETNSVGVDGWPTVEREMTALLEWAP